ncbi:hypothetical protein [Bacillus sp. EB01]|uniref:hypothetical protein n=1 Tax=Bacillus sp. EB01 TaxID=1347086 RepID=UPI0005C4F314|nr:hypothetical protein [Bacillus sp. EB01]
MKYRNLLLSIPLSTGILLTGCAGEQDPPPADDNLEMEEDNQEPDVTEEPSEENNDEEEPDMDEEPSEKDGN